MSFKQFLKYNCHIIYEVSFITKIPALSFKVCVQKCPERTFIFEKELRQNPASFEQLRQNMVCTDEVTNIQTMTFSEAIAYMQQEKCASFVLQSQPGKLI